MLLTVDIGNTNTVFGVFDGDKIAFESKIATNAKWMADQYSIIIDQLLSLHNTFRIQITGAIISSVVPPVTYQINESISFLFNVKPLIVGPGVKTGLNIRIDDPSTLGADLVCVSVAAKELYSSPCIIVDMGTTTKILALDKTGDYLGGVIAPGVRISFDALSSQTAALPLVGIEDPGKSFICTETSEAMRTGVIAGTAFMADGFIERFENEIGDSFVVATGGHASVVLPYCRKKIHYNPHLILQGLRFIWYKNQIKKH